jgi:hypothetical protein
VEESNKAKLLHRNHIYGSSWKTVKTSQVQFGKKYADATHVVTENYQRMCHTHTQGTSRCYKAKLGKKYFLCI